MTTRKKPVRIENIQPRPSRRKGAVPASEQPRTNYNALVVPGVSIYIWGHSWTNGELIRHVPAVTTATWKDPVREQERQRLIAWVAALGQRERDTLGRLIDALYCGKPSEDMMHTAVLRDYCEEHGYAHEQFRPQRDLERMSEHERVPCDDFDRVFQMGEQAEYDSYNLIFTGAITSITAGTITVTDLRIRRLHLYEFIWRNKNLDLARVGRNNADVLQSC